MRSDVKWVFCVLVVLTGASQTEGQSSASPPVYTSTVLLRHVDTSATPDLTEDPGHDVPQLTLYPEGKNQTSSETTTKPYGTVQSETVTNAGFKINVSTLKVDTTSPSESLSSTSASQSTSPLQDVFTAEGRPLLTTEPLTTLSYQPTQTVQDATSTTQYPQTKSPTSATTQTASNSGRSPVGPTHQELPPELNVGDEEPHYRSSSPLDPLLAGLLSVFIVTTAIVFVVLFLKFRQQTSHPEFHRLQDLPMDDLMEDTPLSRYAY